MKDQSYFVNSFKLIQSNPMQAKPVYLVLCQGPPLPLFVFLLFLYSHCCVIDTTKPNK